MPARPTNETNNYIAFGTQSAKDAEATTFYFPKHDNGSGLDFEVDVQSEREGGDGQEIGLSYKSSVKSTAQLNANSRAQLTGLLGKAVLGADTASIVASGVLNSHLQSFAATLPYLTVDERAADQVQRSTNNKVTSLEITAEAGKPWVLSGQFISGGSHYQRDVASALTPTRETVPPHYYWGGSYVLTTGGTSILKVTKWKETIKRNLDDGIQTNGLNNEDVVELNFDCDLDLTCKYEDRFLHQQIKFNGGSQIPFDLGTGAFNAFARAGDAPNASYYVRLNNPNVQLLDAKFNKLDPDGKTIYYDVTARTVKSATTPVFMEEIVGAAASAAY